MNTGHTVTNQTQLYIVTYIFSTCGTAIFQKIILWLNGYQTYWYYPNPILYSCYRFLPTCATLRAQVESAAAAVCEQVLEWPINIRVHNQRTCPIIAWTARTITLLSHLADGQKIVIHVFNSPVVPRRDGDNPRPVLESLGQMLSNDTR